MKKETWYHNLGFFENPFSIKPAAFHSEVIGYDKTTDEINEKIAESNFVFVHGEYGTGKTTILQGIINRFKGKRRVIYYNCNQSTGVVDFNRLLINAGNFFQRLFRMKKKNMIILLDEAHDLSRRDLKRLEEYHKLGFFKSTVFVSKKKDIKLIKEMEALAGENIFILKTISDEEAIQVIRKRIGDIEFISDDMIIRIFKKDKNPRAFLKNCEDVCRFASEQGAEEVTKDHVDHILAEE
jgi:chromosomal replication initiation ATPase DnaA